jgi:predicted dehydrogenase
MGMRFGVIGAGKIGQLRMATIKAHPSLDLVAVFDQSKDAVERAVAGTSAKPCMDLRAFLDSGLDAVVVATPAFVHQDLCVAAFEAGAHVLCEKPLSNTVEGAAAIVTAARKAGRILALGFNLRFYPMVKFARKAVNDGLIGNVTHIRVYGGHDGIHKFHADWEYKMPQSGGGAMMDIGIHMTDLARYFLGEITTVYGSMSESVWHIDGSEDNAIAIFKNPQGIVASYETTWSEWKGYKSHVEIYGDNGMVRAAYAPMSNLLVANTTRGKLRKVRKFYPEVILREKLRGWKTTAFLSFQEELADFLKMIDGDYDVALADGHAGLRSIEVSEAVRLSSRSGQPVDLPDIGNMYGS